MPIATIPSLPRHATSIRLPFASSATPRGSRQREPKVRSPRGSSTLPVPASNDTTAGVAVDWLAPYPPLAAAGPVSTRTSGASTRPSAARTAANVWSACSVTMSMRSLGGVMLPADGAIDWPGSSGRSDSSSMTRMGFFETKASSFALRSSEASLTARVCRSTTLARELVACITRALRPSADATTAVGSRGRSITTGAASPESAPTGSSGTTVSAWPHRLATSSASAAGVSAAETGSAGTAIDCSTARGASSARRTITCTRASSAPSTTTRPAVTTTAEGRVPSGVDASVVRVSRSNVTRARSSASATKASVRLPERPRAIAPAEVDPVTSSGKRGKAASEGAGAGSGVGAGADGRGASAAPVPGGATGGRPWQVQSASSASSKGRFIPRHRRAGAECDDGPGYPGRTDVVAADAGGRGRAGAGERRDGPAGLLPGDGAAPAGRGSGRVAAVLRGRLRAVLRAAHPGRPQGARAAGDRPG